MISFKNLNGISIETISNCLNEAFSDYSIPITFPVEKLEEKFVTENIQRNLSVGAFDDDTLVGIILHGYNAKINKIYNGGTGVIPSHRGQQLTQKMYEFAFTVCKDLGIHKHQLEVISDNIPAIKSYEKVGFSKVRTLNCFKGNISNLSVNSSVRIKELDSFDWTIFQSFWDIEPSWQNGIQAMENNKNNVKTLGAFLNNELVGYLIVNPKLNRIHQLSVAKKYRKQKIGTTLLDYVTTHFSESINVINVDNESEETTRFLEKIGLENFLQQFEMKI